ncbi:Uncharacterized protein BM_BM13462 [Brugia malayi]|uniref:Bm13462 n=1 Tax=Brugia malayi TaxID=6279 RepID=A0A0H5SL74_BRUMA|nr:Uncharacterized protein BM_BM13462 [Brugia malayi]CRZ24511.1 Bm13462 [Brugia malayi]VIO98634.1 Uncharacterized protein BM_BM13462 [Brugia malayi]
MRLNAKYVFCVQHCLLRSSVLFFYAIFSQTTALRCYVSGPTPNNNSVDVPLQECHPTVVSCMTTISWVNNFSSFYCSTRKCITKTGETSSSTTSTFYNTVNDSQTIYCCYTDGCNSHSSTRSLKSSLSFMILITVIFFRIS